MSKKNTHKEEQYLCQSYYDDENVIRDCTCGKCDASNAIKEIIKLENATELFERLPSSLFSQDMYSIKKKEVKNELRIGYVDGRISCWYDGLEKDIFVGDTLREVLFLLAIDLIDKKIIYD